jgi:hypothetical protein
LKKAIVAAGLTPAAIAGGFVSGIMGAEASTVPQQPAPPAAAVSRQSPGPGAALFPDFQKSPGLSLFSRHAPLSSIDYTIDGVAGGYTTGTGFSAALTRSSPPVAFTRFSPPVAFTGSFPPMAFTSSSPAVAFAGSSPALAEVSNPYALGSVATAEQWLSFVRALNYNSAEQLAIAIVDLANRHASNKALSPEFKNRLAGYVLAGSFGITPEQAAALIVAPPGTASPSLLPVISAIHRGPRNFSSIYSEEWNSFIGSRKENFGAAITLALAIVDRANHFAGNKKLSPEFKHGLANTVLTGSYDMTPEQAIKLLAEPSGTPSPLLTSIAKDIQFEVNPYSHPVRVTPSLGGVLKNPSIAAANPRIPDVLRTRLSPLYSPGQARPGSPVTWWWNEGTWQPIPPGMLNSKTSTATLAINTAQYPALSTLIRHADNVDGYLRLLGIESSQAVAEDEKRDKARCEKSCETEKISLGASLIILAGSGVIAVVGAPTVVLSAAGVAVFLGSLGTSLAALKALKECYERSGNTVNADKLAKKFAQLEKQFADLRAQVAST